MNELGRVTENSWLILTDFASKYKVSVSTLRRRIKGHQIKFKFEDGRYLLADEAPADMNPNNGFARSGYAPMHTSQAFTQAAVAAPLVSTTHSIEAERKLKQLGGEGGEEPILSTATQLLNELKRAYSNILQEKEEQMILLKEEVSDLKTLVRVLESDNDRMRAILQGETPTWGNA